MATTTRAPVCWCTFHRAVRLLLAESLSVPDFVGMMKGVENGELKAQGKVIDSITEDQEGYYGFDESDFPDPSSDGRVKMLLSYP